MDHSGHSSSTGSGTLDRDYARNYWYGIAGCVGILAAIRTANMLQVQQRLRLQRLQPRYVSSKPRGWLSQVYATATAVTREALYPQPIYFTGRISKYFSPLPIGRWLLLIIYWIIILSFLWQGTIIMPDDPMYAYRWEKVGFRAAWVSVAQVPFIYLLSCKFNPITLLTGISYERFNWLHRWSARTLFLTVVVHWSFFYHSWSIYDIVNAQINFMPMVKWGFASWAVITWMMLSGFGFFRVLSYEFFVLQHVAGAGVLLWLLFVHVPSEARYNIWISVAFLSFDWGGRIVHGLLQNTHILGRVSSKVPGYWTRLETLPGNVTRLTIEEVDFSWNAGQHIYVNIPSLRPFEMHPFTIANAPARVDVKTLSMLIQTRSGFSRSVHKAAEENDSNSRRRRAFVSGPWGSPPQLLHYETVVLIACSSGASFIVPLLHDLVRKRGCVRNVKFHWIVRSEEHASWFRHELAMLVEQSPDMGLKPQVRVHVTRSQQPFDRAGMNTRVKPSAVTIALESAEQRTSMSSVLSVENDKSPLSPTPHRTTRQTTPMRCISYGRPTLDSLIRPAVEQALGETAVVVCGGLSIAAECRTYVASLADERAVHKGSGAQGIYLFTETYGW